jgi:hypothetical protein
MENVLPVGYEISGRGQFPAAAGVDESVRKRPLKNIVLSYLQTHYLLLRTLFAFFCPFAFILPFYNLEYSFFFPLSFVFKFF